MEMGSGFETKRRKAATKEKRRADDGKAIPSPTAPASLHAAAISLVKLAQYMATPRRIQKSGICSDGRMTDVTKLAEAQVAGYS